MASFDPLTGILHGKKLPQIYSDNVSVAQVLLNVFYKTPDKVIQISDDDNIEITCSQMYELVINIAKNLSNLGYKCGDIAGLIAKNSTYVAPTIFALLLLRLPISPLDTSFSIGKIVEIYRKTQPKVIFCDHNNADKILDALTMLESEARVIILTERINGLLHISELLNSRDDVCEE
jgi:long-subunit acyl-CoA synthetase (AMP-forming)